MAGFVMDGHTHSLDVVHRTVNEHICFRHEVLHQPHTSTVLIDCSGKYVKCIYTTLVSRELM